MKTKIVRINDNGIGAREEGEIAEAGRILQNGGLVVFPTETVYGLGADAFNSEGAARIYNAKGRPSDNPLIVHIADLSRLEQVACFSKDDEKDRAFALAEHFWPGPLTIILPKTDRLPKETTGGLETVAIRFPAHPVARKLITAAGGFVAAPSANISGRPSPTDAKYCIQDMAGKVEMIIDSGETQIGLESTIIDLTGNEVAILRPGIISLEEIESVLGLKKTGVIRTADKSLEESAHPKAPGMKYRHYAPVGELTIVEGSRQETVVYINKAVQKQRTAGKKTAVIASTETEKLYQADVVHSIGAATSGEEIAHNLYRILRQMDDEKADVIYSEAFNGLRETDAIMNRLRKAAGGHIVCLRDSDGDTSIYSG